MATKKQELSAGCLAKTANGEPIFVLRAQDIFAPEVVRTWAKLFAIVKTVGGPQPLDWYAKYQEALGVAAAMETWPTRKIPD
jgi:hypothetical protein